MQAGVLSTSCHWYEILRVTTASPAILAKSQTNDSWANQSRQLCRTRCTKYRANRWHKDLSLNPMWWPSVYRLNFSTSPPTLSFRRRRCTTHLHCLPKCCRVIQAREIKKVMEWRERLCTLGGLTVHVEWTCWEDYSFEQSSQCETEQQVMGC